MKLKKIIYTGSTGSLGSNMPRNSEIVPIFIKGQLKEIKTIKKGNIFDRFAWGVSDVMLSKTDNNQSSL